MLVSRKRTRDMADAPLGHHHHLSERHIDEKWFLRDLLDAYGGACSQEEDRARARRQVVDFLHRHNRISPHEAHADPPSDNSLQLSRARMSSQELFLSVVLEWQRAEETHGTHHKHAARRMNHSSAHLLHHSPSYSSGSSSYGSASSDSESEDTREHRKQKHGEEISPTSVHIVPRDLTPLNLDFAASSPRAPMKKIGIYSPRSRQELLRKYMAKRAKRLSQNTVRYRVRKTLANARPRVKGRFVKTEQPLTAALVESMVDTPISGAD
uniref:CCT domain-containing protein n=1 Tax=Globisporangium ultimum (strain ATCC 200006 / CBS 805.95 / DAOM BR144) TaxID=431595 RepID=K3X1X2_GLOUD